MTSLRGAVHRGRKRSSTRRRLFPRSYFAASCPAWPDVTLTQVKELELSLHVGGSIIPDPKYNANPDPKAEIPI